MILLRFEDWQHEHLTSNLDALLDREQLSQDTELFQQAVISFCQQHSTPMLILFCPPSERFLQHKETYTLLMDLEKRCIEKFSGIETLTVIDSWRFMQCYIDEGYEDVRANSLAHIPYTPMTYSALATQVMRHVSLHQRTVYKVIVVDCDNTLWQGVCGEVGPLGVEISEIFQEFQRFLIAQSETGKLICLCSKNQEADVVAVFEQNPIWCSRKNI